MNKKDELLGCFVACAPVYADSSESEKEKAATESKLFNSYIWGERGISDTLKKLKNKTYGMDLTIILFQFYINPFPFELEHIKEIEGYRKKEKSIGISIIISDENFFCKTDLERYAFLKHSILQKLDLLEEVVKKKKLDTNVILLKQDLVKLFS